ncbi:hypothetical protein BAE44_0001264 [Dichanthelium oligosanthes]|uniref:C2 domain-containing protein n=1 Tax=Dichanthelium oligosanthes TaxID=888268 RepID=A0A1E5WK07_9POAL|nr:hypothetical protein BAE44_0001264 [Dichanthelium oligosanthes]
MESARFRCHRPDEGGGGGEEGSSSSHAEQEVEVPCLLDIYVHHARGIHNICIYANQDVYAKFALTSAPDHAPALSTRVATGGGASPRFQERLPPLLVRGGRIAVDVLKCEVWMRSCAKRLLEDQLLGFALVPLAAVAAADGARLDRDFELSSTDLFHSPAGTILLSLALHSGIPGDACPQPERGAEPSIASEVIILEPPPPVDYSRIEFDDLKVDQENQAMAVQYLPFLHLGETRRPPEAMEDAEMSTSPRGEKTASSDGSKNVSTTSTVSDDRAISTSAGATEKPLADVDEATTVPMSCCSPDTPTSCSGKPGGEKASDVFKSPLGDIDMEAEQSAMQRQIMEMYMKSMQQFSDSLAKVQLPIDLSSDDGVVVQEEEKPDSKATRIQQHQPRQQVKKDGARVFYGSRAFF